MTDFFYSIWVLFKKETLVIIKDKRNYFILIMPIIMQTLLFGYVASYDLDRVDYALLDEDKSYASKELASYFDGSPIFTRKYTLENSNQISGLMDKRKVLIIIHIGPDFEQSLNAGLTVPVQVAVDGRNSNVAGIASGYAAEIINKYTNSRLEEKGVAMPELKMSTRSWFNPNLETRWNIISGMVAVLAVIQVMVLASLSVAREKEQGTFDQLLVTPLGTTVIMLGKALPAVFIGFIQSMMVLLIAIIWFKIPFAGSYLLLSVGIIIFNFCIVGIGLCISAFSETMQQALLYSFSLLMPMVLLSGFATPIASMPESMQIATLLNPARFGVEFAQRVYLEGAGWTEMIKLFIPLSVMAVLTLSLTSYLFRTNLE